MPKFRYLFLAVTSLTLGGCGYFFPSFEGFFGLHSYIHDIPVNRITTELQCELGRFLQETGNQNILDPSAPAGVAIKFQTDQSGTFQYVGIDLSKFGLAGVANLIAPSSKVPSLQAKVQAKTTAFSQLDLAIAQTYHDYQIPKQKPTDKQLTVPGLVRAHCDPSHELLAPLSLGSWLDRFFQHIGRDPHNWQSVCLSKITLSTQIVLLLDVSAGVNPFIASTFILPVSGETFDYNPSATQSLQIVLSLSKDKSNPVCVPPPQPSVTIASH